MTPEEFEGIKARAAKATAAIAGVMDAFNECETAATCDDCGHIDLHCIASGCNHDGCDCEEFSGDDPDPYPVIEQVSKLRDVYAREDVSVLVAEVERLRGLVDVLSGRADPELVASWRRQEKLDSERAARRTT